MAEKSSFFNSVSGDRKYKAEDWAAYFATFVSSGVVLKTNATLAVSADGGSMTFPTARMRRMRKNLLYFGQCLRAVIRMFLIAISALISWVSLKSTWKSNMQHFLPQL